MKLRTFLTTLGVVVGIGALVSMISFGSGMQKNVTDRFRALELFNSITVFPESPQIQKVQRNREKRVENAATKGKKVLDDKAVSLMRGLKGVEAVFPDIRFPAAVRFNGNEEFKLIQVIPAEIANSKLLKLREGNSYLSDDEDSVILSDRFLRKFEIKEISSVLGRKITVSSLAFDFKKFTPFDLASILQGKRLPFSRENYEFTVKGIAERMGFGGPSPLQSDVFIPPGAARRIKKLPFKNLWDLFRTQEEGRGYSIVNVRLSSPRFVDSVKTEIEEMGFQTFALIDQLEEFKTGFLYMDMILAAVGMIALFVASLGIINTMVMSILERYSEIGIMKAVGASDKDIKKIFFFEASSIGFMGGIFGLGLGWLVSMIINRIVNFFLAKQGEPFVEFFNFPWWLCLGAILFAILVSLLAGTFPAVRAARVDPVVALRHD
ncbi:MAG: ABC transporter permease [Candidatus Aminicenantaceae bacterium]